MTDWPDAARDALRQVLDPEAGINIVDLGLVYDVRLEDGRIVVEMTFSTEACPVGPELLAEAERALSAIPGAPPAEVRLTFDPPWTPERITPEGRALLGR
jgi:metal-sulfur cluster biosynthetic enzyme